MARNPYTGAVRPTRRPIGPTTGGGMLSGIKLGIAGESVAIVFGVDGREYTAEMTPAKAREIAGRLETLAAQVEPILLDYGPYDDLLEQATENVS